MCRKVSLLHIPPSAALWSLFINPGVKIAQKHRKKIICYFSTQTKRYPDTQDSCRSYPESNRGRPDSPSTSYDRRGIRTGSDNRYTIKPDVLMVIDGVYQIVQLSRTEPRLPTSEDNPTMHVIFFNRTNSTHIESGFEANRSFER
jgi:hypothetical protein